MVEERELKTGTTTVALVCKDGLVLAADKRATSGYLISFKKFDKRIRTGRENSVKEAANLLATLVYNNIRKLSMIPGISHFLVGGKDEAGFHLYDLAPDGSIVEIDDYVSSGSGS